MVREVDTMSKKLSKEEYDRMFPVKHSFVVELVSRVIGLGILLCIIGIIIKLLLWSWNWLI